jgi:hypothetical protein
MSDTNEQRLTLEILRTYMEIRHNDLSFFLDSGRVSGGAEIMMTGRRNVYRDLIHIIDTDGIDLLGVDSPAPEPLEPKTGALRRFFQRIT